MNSKKYKKIILEILKLYQENYFNNNFDFDMVSKFCKETLNLEEEVYLEILIDMQNLCLIEYGFIIKCNVVGEYFISILARKPRITPLGLEYIDDNKIFNKVLSTTKSIAELASILS